MLHTKAMLKIVLFPITTFNSGTLKQSYSLPIAKTSHLPTLKQLQAPLILEEAFPQPILKQSHAPPLILKQPSVPTTSRKSAGVQVNFAPRSKLLTDAWTQTDSI